MKKRVLSFVLSAFVLTSSIGAVNVSAADKLVAFPGAEGGGMYTLGARAANNFEIYHVTNLNDSGAGSFRDALSQGNRIIVFDVTGTIMLDTVLSIKDVDNITILGQTAPGEGICIGGESTLFENCNNIIVRYMRFRPGDLGESQEDGLGLKQCTDVIIDHCSVSWSVDECFSAYANRNFTAQYNIISNSLNTSVHEKGAHGYGGIWGGKLASFHHNMIAHVANRSPRFNGARYNWSGYTSNKLYSQYQWKNALQAENVDFRNCVVYNCGNGCYGGPGGGQVNIVNNYYKTGPAGATNRVTQVSQADSGNGGNDNTFYSMTSRYFISGNQVNSNVNYDWKGVIYDNSVPSKGGEHYTPDPNHYYGEHVTYETVGGRDCVKIKLDESAPAGEVTTHTAATAYDKVLAYAGASLHRDEVDQRYVTETTNGTATYSGSVTKTKGRIDIVADCKGYTEANFPTGAREPGFDTDGDGIPNDWETANGLDPNNASDGLTYTLDPKGWYTNLEVYANSLVQDIMIGGNRDAENSVEEYYPAYTKEDGTRVEAIDPASTSNISVNLATHSTDAAIRNLAGQRVDANYKGIVISNGKKFIQK